MFDLAETAGTNLHSDIVIFATVTLTLHSSFLGLERKKVEMARGEHINSTEDRAVMHVALRAPDTTRMVVDGQDVVPDVHRVLNAIETYSSDIRAGRRVGVTGKRLTTVVSIGIGGSYLGATTLFLLY